MMSVPARRQRARGVEKPTHGSPTSRRPTADRPNRPNKTTFSTPQAGSSAFVFVGQASACRRPGLPAPASRTVTDQVGAAFRPSASPVNRVRSLARSRHPPPGMQLVTKSRNLALLFNSSTVCVHFGPVVPFDNFTLAVEENDGLAQLRQRRALDIPQTLRRPRRAITWPVQPG